MKLKKNPAIIQTSVGARFLWICFGEKYLWLCAECSKPVWWKPRFEKYSFGRRFGWLLFAFGFGLVNERQMNVLVIGAENY